MRHQFSDFYVGGGADYKSIAELADVGDVGGGGLVRAVGCPWQFSTFMDGVDVVFVVVVVLAEQWAPMVVVGRNCCRWE